MSHYNNPANNNFDSYSIGNHQPIYPQYIAPAPVRKPRENMKKKAGKVEPKSEVKVVKKEGGDDALWMFIITFFLVVIFGGFYMALVVESSRGTVGIEKVSKSNKKVYKMFCKVSGNFYLRKNYFI